MQTHKRSRIMPDVTLTYVKTEKFKTDYISLALLRPLCTQEAAKNSLLPEVLLQGCRSLPDMRTISDHLDNLYGAGIESINLRRGEVHILGLAGDCISGRYAAGEDVLPRLISTMGELLLCPVLQDGAFCTQYVEIEKTNLIRAIQAQINDKRSYAMRRLLELMFAGEAYGVDRRGTEQEVAAITPQSLYAHYRQVLSTSRMEIFYMGAAEEDQILSSLRQALQDLPRSQTTAVGTQVIRRAAQVREISETMDVTQGKLVMGLRTGCTASDPDYPALLLLNGVLGGTVSSKLFENVREKRSLCYYASSSLDKTKGIMAITSGISFENYETAKAAILEQIEDCRRGSITESELEGARSYLISTLQMADDSMSRQMELSLGLALDASVPDFQQQIDALRAADLGDVQRAARNLSLDTIYFMKGETTDAAL